MNGIGLLGGDFPVIKSDSELILENLNRILTTLPGENVGNIEFGCLLREYLFNFSDVLLEDLEQVVVSAILKWEPRVKLFNVDIILDAEMPDRLSVVLNLSLLSTFEKFDLVIPINY